MDSASAADLGALSAELDRVGLGAASIEVRSTSLRDAFLEVTQ
ncbi:daunorubicin resistance ABC transporter ATP-binding subunit DrrA [Mycobacteroides abscessus subsp. abscessus]|nr:daunorubicin resistance ABC transporter ATP-binding subunit DrrA [Mycobacteroides abscessus subsp. abscessus]